MADANAVTAQAQPSPPAETGTRAEAEATGEESPVPIPTTVTLRAPSTCREGDIIRTAGDTSTWHPPPIAWLARTWTVTHSTLPMWRKAKNVRITYKPLPLSTSTSSSSSSSSVLLLDDEVTSTPTTRTLLPQPRSIRGIDTPDGGVAGAWDWRGRGWLRIASSHWEVLGWGVFEGESWVVTWFQKSIFTPEGVDLYSGRRGGRGRGRGRLVEEVRRCFEGGMAGKGVGILCVEELREVLVDDDDDDQGGGGGGGDDA